MPHPLLRWFCCVLLLSQITLTHADDAELARLFREAGMSGTLLIE